MGYPTYLIYPLAIAKLLVIIVIWGNLSKLLLEWAYAGFLFNTVLVFFARYMVRDGQHLVAVIVFFAVMISYNSGKSFRF